MQQKNGKRGEATAEHPVFDFSNVSYSAGRQMARLQLKIQHMQKRITDARPEDDIDEMLEEMDELLTDQEANMLAGVVSVPHSWLIKDAPPVIDWSDATSIKWLRYDKFSALMKAVTEAQRGN